MSYMNLGKLILILEKFDPTTEVKDGFGNPHSYRGYYEELAFEPMETTIGKMLEEAKSAVGTTYRGYKGGNFTMDNRSDVYIAYVGCCGELITKSMLGEMLL